MNCRNEVKWRMILAVMFAMKEISIKPEKNRQALDGI